MQFCRIFQARTSRRGDEGRNAVRALERPDHRRVARTLGRNARVVRRRLPRKRQVWRDHVRLVRHRDPARDRDLESAASTQTSAGDSRNGFADESVCPTDLADDPGLRRDEPRVDRQRLASTIG